ncbi:mariner Mos1 transposase [Trichonephila clavipes]|nr:mariner Mos1 transposase [Trichonephila clavipes]
MVRPLLVKERAESGFNASRTVILVSKEKVFEDAELEALLDQDSCQTQQELAGSLGVTQQAISKRLKVMGMIQKQGNWVPYELRPRDVERRLFACEQLLARQRRKGSLHPIVTGDEKWVRYDNPKRRKSWGYPGYASTSTAKPNIHGSKVLLSIGWLGVVCYELLKATETITGDRYRTQLMRLSRALKDKRPQYNERHDKVILQHDNARPHVVKVVKTYLETLKWEVLPHPLYSPDLSPSDYHLFRSMAHGLADQHFRSYEENNHDVQELWFQQDGATCHTARATTNLLKDTFGDRLISRFGPVNWPPRSCDLTPLDYFLWGYVQSLVYADKPQTLDHLEDNIRRVIADIRPLMLEKVIENWTSRLDSIRASRGSPMPEIIFKM